MLISKALNDKINEQIVNELFAAHTYLSMASYFKKQGLFLLADMFRKQADEEANDHARKFMDYLYEREGEMKLGAVPAPAETFTSVPDALKAAYEHELKVSDQINALAALADKDGDRTSTVFLDWFVEEQIEEVSSMRKLWQVASMSGPALLQVEAYLVHIGK